MSEDIGKPPGFEHLINPQINTSKADSNILIKDAEAVAKMLNDKIQNLNAADGLFFMQQVGKNLLLSPKKENSDEPINANLQQNNIPMATGDGTRQVFTVSQTNANNSMVTTFNAANDDVSYGLEDRDSVPQSSNKEANGQKLDSIKIKTDTNRRSCNVSRINDWLKDSNKKNHQMNEVKNDNKEDMPSEPIHSHVANVVENSSDWLKNNETQTIKKSLNILILGETGVGKSTWINAFANYLTYGTLEEAITAETPICVIPTKFTLFDNNNQCHNVMLGNHENECFENAGQSATQNAKTYLFETEKYNVYLIDTPGMNDTRGIEQDEENMQKILRAISPFTELHAICFLFKPNESRLKDYFRYSINTLLRNLHKTSLNNACFVFTNTATTFYKPGETLGLLEIFFNELNEREQLSVPLNDDNVFCLENEAFRFCCAYFSRVLFDSTEIETYSQSWKHSANEINRFLDYAATLCPHSTAETLSINETKIWIMQLITPIVDVCELIQTNLQKLEDHIRELESLKNNLNELKKRKFIQTISLGIKNLEKPQIVCTNEKCVRYENIMGHMEPIFKTVCHKDCFTKSLLGCAAFGDRGKCRNCGCSYKDHMRIFYEQQIVVTDTEVEIQPSNERNSGQMKKKLIEKIKEMIEKYKTEYNFIMVAMAKFSLFLSQNGIAQKYDIFENQIEDLIEREEKLIESVPNYEDQKYYRLTDYLIVDYRDIREKVFEENVNLSLIEIQDIRQKLFAMPLMGSKIAEIYNIYVKTEENDHIENISRCDKETVKEQSISWYQSVKQLFFR